MTSDEELVFKTVDSSTEPASGPESDGTKLAGALQTLRDSGQDFLNKVQDMDFNK